VQVRALEKGRTAAAAASAASDMTRAERVFQVLRCVTTQSNGGDVLLEGLSIDFEMPYNRTDTASATALVADAGNDF